MPVTIPATPAPIYVFAVTVTGPGASSTANVTISGISVPPIIPTVIEVQVKLGKDEWDVAGTVNNIVAGSTINQLIVTDSFGNTVDLIAGAGGMVADIDLGGNFQWGSKDIPLTIGLAAGQWTIHAISSTGNAGPAILVGVN